VVNASWHIVEPGLLVVSGELDVAVKAQFQAALIEAAYGTGATRVDLARVTFMDSSALHALIDAQQTGIRLTLERPTANTLRLLSITGAAGLFTIGHEAPPTPPAVVTRASLKPAFRELIEQAQTVRARSAQLAELSRRVRSRSAALDAGHPSAGSNDLRPTIETASGPATRQMDAGLGSDRAEQ
jgi:anti-sigma B factor antagonist